MKKLMKSVVINTWSGIPDNLKDVNDDEDWWVTQFHFLPFIMYQLCDGNKIIFGWLFWSVSIRWPRRDE